MATTAGFRVVSSMRTYQTCQEGRRILERGPKYRSRITQASTDALVRAWVWPDHDELIGAAVLEKASLLRHHKLLRAGI